MENLENEMITSKSKSIGEIKLNVEFIKGNNDALQNEKEAFARMYNRLEKMKAKVNPAYLDKISIIELSQASIVNAMTAINLSFAIKS